MLILLKMNKIKVKYTQQQLIELGLKTSEGMLKEKDIFKINYHIIN